MFCLNALFQPTYSYRRFNFNKEVFGLVYVSDSNHYASSRHFVRQSQNYSL